MRTLLSLIKRQFTDDGPCFVAVAIGGIGCLLLLALLAFIYPHEYLVFQIFLFVVLPILIGTCLFAFGWAQARHDRDAVALLSVRSPGGLIVAARFVVGVMFAGIITAMVALAVAGAFMSGLLRWSMPLFSSDHVDLSAALFEIGVASYCFGVMVAPKAQKFPTALRAWPLVLVVTSLVVAKGPGRPLAAVLVPLVAVALLHLLAQVRYPHLASIPLGVTVLILTLTSLYWLRYSLDVDMARTMLAVSDDASVRCEYEFPAKRPADVYPEHDFFVHAGVHSKGFPFFHRAGLRHYFEANESGSGSLHRHFWQGRWSLSYDAPKGVFVRRSDRNALYAGSEAMAKDRTDGLGHFDSPVLCRVRWDEAVVFDRQHLRFYSLDFGAERVRCGPRLEEGTCERVVGITSMPELGICAVHGYYPSAHGQDVLYGIDSSGAYVPIIDESGAVAVLDLRTWRLTPRAGHLPAPLTWSGLGSPKPRDLSHCDVEVIVKRSENEYAGLMTASLSRQHGSVAVAVFDRDGRTIGERRSGVVFAPWLTSKYFVESLHPPVLALASFFTAYSFEAGATHRAIFLMPNSFVALQRDRQTNLFFQLLWALLFMVPGLLFAGFLGWRIVKDAGRIGLSRRSRRRWFLAALAFGLPAYITYRHSRPRVALLSCRNCGNLRRPDMDKCHHCHSEWDVPALNAPVWRVSDGSQ